MTDTNKCCKHNIPIDEECTACFTESELLLDELDYITKKEGHLK